MLSGTAPHPRPKKKKSKKLLESFHEAAGGLCGMKVMDGKEAAKPRAEEKYLSAKPSNFTIQTATLHSVYVTALCFSGISRRGGELSCSLLSS